MIIINKNLLYSLLKIFFISLWISHALGEIEELSFCSEPQSSAILVSTLDGKFTKLSGQGELKWVLDTEPGSLLVSNIHKLELTNNGQWIRIIPSLSGMLYKFDGNTVDPISVSAESLLKSSFKYSDDLVMAGSIEVRTYGVGFRSGSVFYECSPLKCKNVTDNADVEDDVLILKRTTQTVRAIELRTGNEKWNFSVGEVEMSLPRVSCIDVNAKKTKWNITAVLPDGLLKVNQILNNVHSSWEHSFFSPIVKVWKWNGIDLEEVDMFLPQDETIISPISAALYIGMHNKQLYIHESEIMQNMLVEKNNHNLEVAESKSLSKIPWKPVPASTLTEEDESTALAVLYGSPYVNGNGYFLYTEKDLKLKNTQLCEKNVTVADNMVGTVEHMIVPMWIWWKEIAVISLTTAMVFHMAFRYGQNRRLSRQNSATNTSLESPITEEKPSESSASVPFSSRYMSDFETLQCLGKGGFGIVFQVKQKIDECQYALKRITLPNEKTKRERVMREVKALAKLEHQNIVRYFNSWVECPPSGWQQSHDDNWMSDNSEAAYMATSTRQSMATSTHRRTNSVSIVIDAEESLKSPSDSSDDFICFEEPKPHNSSDTSIKNNVSGSQTNAELSHSQKKINWRRPFRKSYSLDLKKREPLAPPIFLYIQMQLCQKENLKDWLVKNQFRDKGTVVDLFGQIISAVEYVHLQGLIHRDLKPGNIFFSLEGQIKVGDFGLVKDIESCYDLESTGLASPNFSNNAGHTKEVGTRLYMSPEQLENRKYDYKVDIYSLGLIFIELLIPFSTDMERFRVLSAVRENEFPKDFKSSYKNEYCLLKSMLCENPKERLTTIGIRSKPPFNQQDPNYGEDYYYELPKILKNIK